VERGHAHFGFVNALKPPGPSSTSFGSWVRRLFGGTSVGHWGTLDPAASGVLVLAVGRASRLLPYLHDADKRYVFLMRVGTATDTADATGSVIARADVPGDWARELEAAVAATIGPLEQTPPMYSAVKVRGRPLYKSAREGKHVERASRLVEIRSMGVLDVVGQTARIDVVCSSGTYVRTLCEQLGKKIGVPAHLGMLLRTKAGPFDIADSRTPSRLSQDPAGSLIDPATVVPLPRVEIDATSAKRFAHGLDVGLDDVFTSASIADGDARDVMVVQSGRLIGIGRLSGSLSPMRVLWGGDEN
jgi:tRNA pseudouridine55 synthase